MAGKKELTLFGFFAITASLFITVYEYPTFATSGFKLAFFLIFCGILWFLPVALCSAEMATVKGWQEGGIFTWVGKTLGERYGFAAIFFQWFQVTVGFVTMIYFILGALAYVFDFKALDNDPLIKFLGVIVIFWILTFVSLGGTNRTAKITKLGFIFGITLPVILMFILAIFYFAKGNPIEIKFTMDSFVPKITDFSALAIFILAYMGVEASAPHINEMKNPKRDYPIAMVLIVIVGIGLSTLGGLSVASVVPAHELSLSSGVVQAFERLILQNGDGLTWLVKVLAFLVAFGVMGQVSSWIVGPTSGMYTVAQKGVIPKKLAKTNKNDVPVILIGIQGIMVTAWAAILTFGGGGNNVSFLTAISLTVVIYLVGYVLFFLGYLVLVFKKKNLERSFEIGGGPFVKTLIACIGLFISVLAIAYSFVPPSSLKPDEYESYKHILAISLALTTILPFVIYMFTAPDNQLHLKELKTLDSSKIDKFTHPMGRIRAEFSKKDQSGGD